MIAINRESDHLLRQQLRTFESQWIYSNKTLDFEMQLSITTSIESESGQIFNRKLVRTHKEI
jgi:hypothetical protein